MIDALSQRLPLEVVTAFNSKKLHKSRFLDNKRVKQFVPSRIRRYVAKLTPQEGLYAQPADLPVIKDVSLADPKPDFPSKESIQPVTVVVAGASGIGMIDDINADADNHSCDQVAHPGNSGEPPRRPPGGNPIEVPDPDGSEEARYTPHPIDRLRPEFNHHFIGPLSHVVIINTIDAIGESFVSSLQGIFGKTLYTRTSPSLSLTQNTNAVSLLRNINYELREAGRRHLEMEEPISARIDISPRQRAATIRFGNRIVKSSLEVGLFNELIAIERAILTIADKHPELQLSTIPNLAAFLRDPNTPNIFRGFANGGNAFLDSFSRTEHPATVLWRSNKRKPVLKIYERSKRVTRDVVRAAMKNRKINERLLDHPLSDEEKKIAFRYGIVDGNAKRFSSGCPAKYLFFQTNVKMLVDNGLALSTDQADALTTITNPPVVQKLNDANYRIERDAYSEVCNLFADALDAIAVHTSSSTDTV